MQAGYSQRKFMIASFPQNAILFANDNGEQLAMVHHNHRMVLHKAIFPVKTVGFFPHSPWDTVVAVEVTK